MVGASKILTVSYGTFSCTLEGFDDPFNTMKAIAEYFRDLAAEDRYFGAEPPTPDAAMLHRIAEREVQRRVEAKVQENGVILRAQSDEAPIARPAEIAAAAVPVMELPAAVEEKPAFAEALAEPLIEAVLEPEAEEIADEPAFAGLDEMAFDAPVESIETPQPALNDMPEGVAARLAKIRAAVALTEAAPVAAASDYVEDQHAEESFAAFETLEDAVVPSLSDVSFSAEDDAEDIADLAVLDGVDLADAVADAPVLEDLAVAEERIEDAFRAETVEESPAEDTLGEVAVAEDDLPEDALAEVELPGADLASDDDDLFDDEQPDEGYLEPAVAELVAEPAVAAEPETVEADTSADDDVLASLAATFAGDQPAGVTDADTIVFNDEDDLLLSAIETEEAVAETVADEAVVETVDAAVDESLSDDLSDAAEAAAADPVAETQPETVDETPVVAPAVAAESDSSDKLQRARARIIRVRRAPEIAITKPAEPAAPVLSDEAEAELQRELAALEDLPEPVAEAPAIDADDDLRRQLSALGADDGAAAVPATAPAALDPAVQDESLRRLMDQTQSEMAEPSNRRRLSSIAHLKAAVAATIAERFGTKPKPVEEVEATRTEPYRNDLARAVRPVRPAAGAAATERPTPLVLVSEQRIDRPAAAAPAATGPVTPVRPRRVSAQAVAVQETFDEDFDVEEDEDTDNIFGDSKGFAEFADRIGATDLSELLEAAAAYSSAVEGRKHFTRPQLLRQISAVTGTDVSREDELRGFGALLRDGRIVKVKRGQFALTDQSSYLDEARKIGS